MFFGTKCENIAETLYIIIPWWDYMGINSLMCGYLWLFLCAFLIFLEQHWLTVHTNQCEKPPCHEGILLQFTVIAEEVYVLNCFTWRWFLALITWAVSTSGLAYLWHACCFLLHKAIHNYSIIALFPIETKYNLRIFLNTVLQRATTNPLNDTALKTTCHFLVYTFRLVKQNNTNYSLKQLAFEKGWSGGHCVIQHLKNK